MCATFISTSFSRQEERRRNLRLRVSTLIYAQLGSDNGGVVINLGVDGILFQAAHKLSAHQDSTITLKLRGAGLNAEIAGKIVWLSATQKAVGISFKSLPANVKQSIMDWMARESSSAESDPPKRGTPRRSMSEIAAVDVQPEKGESSDGSPILGLPPLSELKQSLVQALKEQEIRSPQKALEIAADVPPPPPRPAEIKPVEKTKKIVSRAAVPAIPAIPTPAVPKPPSALQIMAQWIPPEVHAAWNRLTLKQRKLLTHAGTVCLGMMIGLLLIVVITHLHGSSDHANKNITQQQSAMPPDSPGGESSSTTDFPKQGPPLPAAVHPEIQSKPPETSMFSRIVGGIFGSRPDGPPKINDYQLGLAVWTSKSSGYFYCSDDPYVKSVQSGVPMLQGDALQAGYRPRLGQFCN